MITPSRAGVAAALLASTTLLGLTQAHASPTSPDNGFDSDGVLTIHSVTLDQVLTEMSTLPNGKTLVLTATLDEPALELYRLRGDGSADPTFGGGDGVFPFALAANYEDVRMTVDRYTGKIYITTFIDNGTTSPTTVWRFNGNGSLDTAYGGTNTGHVVINKRLVLGLAALPGGKLLMAGDDFNASTANVWRLKNNGHRDSAFGSNGTKVLSTDSNDEATSVLVQTDGKILVAASHYNATASTLQAFRLNSNGSFDHSFSGDGKAVVDPSSAGVTTSTVWTPQVLLRPDGRTVYVAGLNQNNGGFVVTLLLAGLTKSGKPDQRFGKHVFSGITDTWGQAALARDGKVVVAGSIPPFPSSNNGVYRFTNKGQLDHSWSGNGVFVLPQSSDTIRVGITPQGRVLVARTVGSAPYDAEIRALRGTKTPLCHGKLATQFGSRATDVIAGTAHADVLVGLGGNDKISGKGGKDLICGVGGNDKLAGGPGNDQLYGQAGDDTLVGGPGHDTLVGGPGRNVIRP